jgi:hypothetical protein
MQMSATIQSLSVEEVCSRLGRFRELRSKEIDELVNLSPHLFENVVAAFVSMSIIDEAARRISLYLPRSCETGLVRDGLRRVALERQRSDLEKETKAALDDYMFSNIDADKADALARIDKVTSDLKERHRECGLEWRGFWSRPTSIDDEIPF